MADRMIRAVRLCALLCGLAGIIALVEAVAMWRDRAYGQAFGVGLCALLLLAGAGDSARRLWWTGEEGE